MTTILQFDFADFEKNGLVTDHSLGLNNGTAINDCTPVEDPIFGTCAQFDGESAYVKIDHISGSPNPLLNLQQGYTLCAWVNFEDFTQAGSIFQMADGPQQLELMSMTANNVDFTNNSLSATKSQSFANVLTAKTWVHLTLVCNGSNTITLYVNGSQAGAPVVNSAFSPFTDGAGDDVGASVGCSGTESTAFFHGKMAWLALYNSALTAAEIGTDMQMRKQLVPMPSLRYDFKNIPATNVLKDISGNGYDGTIEAGCTPKEDPVMGGCLNFDGTTGCVEITKQIAGTGNTDFSKGFTVTAWMSLNDIPVLPPPFIMTINGTSEHITISLDGGKPYLFLEPSDKGIVFTPPEKSKDLPAMTIDQWYHIAITVTAEGNGYVYCNGETTSTEAQVMGIDFPAFQSTSVYLGRYPAAPTIPWSHVHFNGKLAWLSVYNHSLSAEQVNADMLLGKNGWRAGERISFPVDFSLYSIYNHDNFPVLYIQNDNTGNDIHLDITNASAKPINLFALKTSGSQPTIITEASEEDYHFQLRFRPGILNKTALPAASSIQLNPAEANANWAYNVGTSSKGDGVAYISFLYKAPAAAGTNLAPQTKLSFTINNVAADPQGGARSTGVELLYNDVVLGVNPTPNSKGVSGSRMTSLSLVNHNGQKDIPLHCDVLGVASVLNDGASANQLVFRLANIDTKALNLSTDANEPSKIEVLIPVKTSSAQDEWALVDEATTNSLQVAFPILGVVDTATNDNKNTTLSLNAPPSQALAPNTQLVITESSKSSYAALSLVDNAAANSTSITITPPQSPPSFSLSAGQLLGIPNNPIGEVANYTSGVITLKAPLKQALTSADKIVVLQGKTVVVKSQSGNSVKIKGLHSILPESVIRLADDTAWSTMVNSVMANSTTPYASFTLTNLADVAIGVNAGLEFALQGIISNQSPGQSYVLVKYYNMPGYWDGQFIVPVEKSPLVAGKQNIGVGTLLPTPTAAASTIYVGSADAYLQSSSGEALTIEGKNDIALNPTSGKVGIGTSSPSENLEIYGESATLYLNAKQAVTKDPGDSTIYLTDKTHSISVKPGSAGGKMDFKDANGFAFNSGKAKAIDLLTLDSHASTTAINGAVNSTTGNLKSVPLAVNGNCEPKSSGKTNGSLNLRTTADGGSNLRLGTFNQGNIDLSNCYSWIQSSFEGNSAQNLTLYLNPNGGEVKIGYSGSIPNPGVKLQVNCKGVPAASGNINSGFAVTDGLVGASLNSGVYTAADAADSYTWIQGAFANKADAHLPISLNPLGGLVGIGVTNPQAPLHIGLTTNVQLSEGDSYGWYAAMASSKSGPIAANTIIKTVSIYAAGALLSTGSSSLSDLRIKSDLQRSSAPTDLEMLLSLRVTDFGYKDKPNFGEQLKKGLIAQEVEEIFPTAVSHHTDFVPDIYAVAETLNYNAATKELTISLKEPHGLKGDDLLKLLTQEGEVQHKVAHIVDEYSFVLKDWKSDIEKMFVFGKQVDDFRAVDYDQVSMLGIGAIQELHKEVQVGQQERESLKAENLGLRKELNQLKQEMAEVMTLMKAQTQALGEEMAQLRHGLNGQMNGATKLS